MKIALFGGSFDPPHKGHESVIKEALKVLEIDKLIIMPTFISPFKKAIFASQNQRLEWTKKLWGAYEKVEISSFEIEQNRPVPSIESVLYLISIYNPSKFYLIIGADHLQNLHTWHEFERLKNLVEFVIARRNFIEISNDLKILDTNIKISSSQIRAELDFSDICDEIKNEVQKTYKKEKNAK